MTTLREAAQQAISYNAETGVFTWLDGAWHKRNRGVQAGSKKRNGYIEIQFNGKMLKAHRLAWMLVYGELADDVEIDHIDGNRSNNRLSNLRAVDRSINQQNQRKARSDSTSGLLGVSWYSAGDKWKADIRVNGKKKHLGYFHCKDAAHQAYLNAKRVMHEGNTL
jgi:hypothetical protein